MCSTVPRAVTTASSVTTPRTASAFAVSGTMGKRQEIRWSFISSPEICGRAESRASPALLDGSCTFAESNWREIVMEEPMEDAGEGVSEARGIGGAVAPSDVYGWAGGSVAGPSIYIARC